ncbi:variable surface protein [Plasmodium gonderi]|uniref:Variable surface protein n=1 Tax=Plasmodium gonderi TaxID=77519 RepID=A0A1Y1JPK2_PLAGO|nr:variable surface protein [Plasmodium gonderi]GAW84546.1 variable surface protein [Plasmodium gonderi]
MVYKSTNVRIHYIDTSKLPSQKFYQILHDRSTDLSNNEEYCNSFSYSFGKEKQITDFCLKLRILTQIFLDGLIFNSEECNLDDVISYRNWKNVKELCDYFVDYNYLISLAEPSNANCIDYLNYIEKKTTVFQEIENYCNKKISSQCPNFYNKFLSYNPKSVLSTITCKSTLPKEEKALEIPLKIYNSTTTFGKILLGLAFTSMFFATIYKFTPIGKQLQNNFPNIKNRIRNLNEKVKRLFFHRSENFNPLCEYLEKKYIGYNPV